MISFKSGNCIAMSSSKIGNEYFKGALVGNVVPWWIMIGSLCASQNS